MKNIFVTGAGGFIGSHLVEQLIKDGYNVCAFVRYNSTNTYGWLENSVYKKNIKFLSGDTRDYDSVFSSIRGCDTVFHLAALIGIPYSYISPLAYIRTNVEGTYNVLESSRRLELENVLITSTSETYGTAQYVPIDEKHPLVGQSPYSASKIAADQLSISYYRSFSTPVKIVRPFNTYGPRQSARAIIPTVITQILSGVKEIKLGNLAPTRDLSFVMDTVKGFLAIAENSNLNGEIVNIGSGYEISVKDLVTQISELMGVEVAIKSDENRVRPVNSEVERLYCDNSKIKSLTNWRPEYDLKKGLLKTIQWLTENLKYYKTEVYNV